MEDDLAFFITTMPNTRPADYYLGCLGGSVFMDFNNCDREYIRLTRISFDGHGCCDLQNEAMPMDEIDSRTFKEMMRTQSPDQSRLTEIVKKTISNNRKLLWEDALNEYCL